MPGTCSRKGSWILLGLGGCAAALALYRYRYRSRPQGTVGVSPSATWFPASADAGPIPLDWNPEQAPDGASPAGPSPLAEAEAGTEAGSPSPSGSEPWLDPLRMALDSNPHAYGYGKSAWSAPLLSRYLQDTQGLEVPLPAVRKALRDLGYRWENTRYVKAGELQEGFTSEGMG